MTKKLLLSATAMILSLGLVACASGQETDSSSDRGMDDNAANRNIVIAGLNQSLSQISYSPNDRGWEYKATAVPAADIQKWANNNKELITEALNKIDTGYALQITGHTCSIGPRERQADGRLGNAYYSTQRAQQVLAGLRNAGIPTDKLVVKGVADDEPLSGVDSKDQTNRRVTFKIVVKPTN